MIDALRKLINEADKLCSEIESETKAIKDAEKEVMMKKLSNYRATLREYMKMMNQANLKEFSIATNMRMRGGYGRTVYMVLDSNGCISFAEPGTYNDWARCYPSNELEVDFYDKHFEEIEKELSKAIMNAMAKRAEKAIKENEEVIQ